MKIHRFIGAFSFEKDQVTLTDPALVHQMGRVLRLQVGESVILCDGQGTDAQGVIESMDRKTVIVHIQERRANASEPTRHVTLYLAILKREHLELAVQKATEVGVCEIIPLITARTIKQNANMERLQTIAREAAEQSGRGRVPVVHEPMSFEQACKQRSKNEASFFFDLNAPILDTRYAIPDTPTCLFIGPEGGWTPEERKQAESEGLTIVGLGPRTLRGETAATIATYLVCNL